MRLLTIVDDTPGETADLLRRACASRDVEYVEVDAASFDYREESRPAPGDLLFRPATSMASLHVEQFLFRDGVATFYVDSARVYLDTPTPRVILSRAGVPVPLTIYCASSDRAVLDGYVERLGGCPVVAHLGAEGGRGTLRMDSLASLYSTMDFCVDHGLVPELSAFIPDAVHWRVVVVGTRAIAAYVNPIKPNDFRSTPSADASDYTVHVDPELAAMAIAAARALGVEFGGVDILVAAGRSWVLEVNFPCYFPQAQIVAGIDVAGAIVEGLVEKARGGGTTPGPAR